MAHVNSESFQDDDGIFLYQMEGDRRKKRIGGPYFSTGDADKASKAASEKIGEGSVEDYMKFLQKTNPGVIGGQSPIPTQRRSLNDEEFNEYLNNLYQRGFERQTKGLLDAEEPSSPADWFVNPAEGQQLAYRGSTYDPAGDSPINYEALGIIPQEPTSLFNFVTDIKYDPKSFRVPVDPTPARWGADMSGVKFGTALPDRNAVEDMILEASGIAGVAPQFTEGYRTEEQNIKLGAHEESKHMTGQAFDLAISRNKEKDKKYERELQRLFVPLGFTVLLKGDHIHLQTPPKDVDLLPNSSWR